MTLIAQVRRNDGRRANPCGCHYQSMKEKFSIHIRNTGIFGPTKTLGEQDESVGN